MGADDILDTQERASYLVRRSEMKLHGLSSMTFPIILVKSTNNITAICLNNCYNKSTMII